MYRFERQKQGLPHVLISIRLKQNLLPSQIDNRISAEIPNPEEDKNLYDMAIIKNNPAIILHTKWLLHKKYLRERVRSDNDYPLFRRRCC